MGLGLTSVGASAILGNRYPLILPLQDPTDMQKSRAVILIALHFAVVVGVMRIRRIWMLPDSMLSRKDALERDFCLGEIERRYYVDPYG